MSCIRVLYFVIAAVCALPLGAAGPNFLVLVADDMRADAIHGHGGAAALTPVLDRLAATGFSFREAHCMGSNSGAVCIPSRAMMLSGRSLFAVKNDLAGEKTLPEELGADGYETFIAGKWHNGKSSCERSFASGEAVFLGGMTDQFHPLLAPLKDHRLGTASRSESFSTDAIARAAVEFLSHRDRDQPFFAWISFTVPHDPRTPPTSVDPGPSVAAVPAGAPPSRWQPRYDRPFASLHDPATLPLPENFLPQHPFDNGWLMVRDEQLLAWPREPQAVQRELAAYHGLMTHLDARIGDILAALDTSGEAEETYVIFLSDHGLALGSHGLLGKQNLYEHSMRAPLIIRGPGVPAGKESAALVYLHDLKPTIEELAGRPVAPLSPDETASRSLVPWWREPAAAAARSCLLLAFTDTMRAVRTSRWKLIRYPQTDQSQLFDLVADPHERHNLAARQPDELASLRQRLENAQRAAGDSLSWTADTVRPAFLDLTGHARDPFAGRPWDAPPR